jgi:Winged helix DNA-binding domain
VTTLSARGLNRATLDRQLLLRRHPLTAQEAVRRLAGLQGQAPLAPYVGLWCRLAGFEPGELSDLIDRRVVVRAPAMRGTVHVLDAEDLIAFRSLFGPLLAAVLETNFRKDLGAAAQAELAAHSARLLAGQSLSRAAIGRALAPRWPDAGPMALAYAATYLVPVVQVPPRGIWGKSAQATFAEAGSWLGRPVAEAGPDAAGRLVLRYLAAFGPATVADAATWSGLTRLREVTDRLELRRLRGPDGAELLDRPDVSLPDEDAPAPPRFLPEYDNLLLSYADRRRVIPHDRRPPLWPGNGASQGTLLIDGSWHALWKITRKGGAADLAVSPFRALTTEEEADITQEGARLLAFTAPGLLPGIRFLPPG